jgi:uncharacterized membrane protein YebE (DUF533 family)
LFAVQQRFDGMKSRIAVVMFTIAGFGLGNSASANAIGCLSGGIAGAVAGHMAHHGVLGAVGGCIAGHEYNKHQKRQAAQRQVDQANQPDTPHSGAP